MRQRKVELPALTGIRFYAAILVYLYHVSVIPGMEALSLFYGVGHAGVSLFFVLSGFILTYNYADVFRTGISASGYKEFVWGRFAKIYPVHVVTLLMALPVAILSPNLPLDWRAVPVHLLLLQCVWPSSTPAFSDYLNVPSWSISCEWFFYLLAPVVMFLAFGQRRRFIPVVALLGYALGLGLALWEGPSYAARFYFVSRFAPSRFLEFVAGVVAARVFLEASRERLERVSGWAQAVGIVLLIAGAVGRDSGWPLWGGLPFVPGATLLVLGLAAGRGRLAAHLGRPTLVRLGTATFAFYLLHLPVVRAVKGVYLSLGSAIHSWPEFGALVITLFVTVQAAALVVCDRYELPLQRRLRDLLSRPPQRGRPASVVAIGAM